MTVIAHQSTRNRVHNDNSVNEVIILYRLRIVLEDLSCHLLAFRTETVVRCPVLPSFCRKQTVACFSIRKTFPVVRAAVAGYSPLFNSVASCCLCMSGHRINISDQLAFPASAVHLRTVGRSAKATRPTMSRQTFGKKIWVGYSICQVSAQISIVLAHHSHIVGFWTC